MSLRGMSLIKKNALILEDIIFKKTKLNYKPIIILQQFIQTFSPLCHCLCIIERNYLPVKHHVS